MTDKERLELAHWAIDESRKHGADQAAVDVAASTDIEVSCRKRAIEKLKESTQRSLTLTVYSKGRFSSHSTNDLRRESLEKFIAEGVAMTGYLGEDPNRTLPDPKYYQGRQDIDLKIRDSSYESLTTEERVKFARAIEDAALQQGDRVISCTASFSDNLSESVKVHSNGFEGSSQETSFNAGAEVTANDPNGGRPEDWDWRTVRFRSELPSPVDVGQSAAARALRKIGQTKMPSGVYDMIVENRAGGNLLGALMAPMQGRALQQKSSCLDGKLGQKIFSEKLTWWDDPFLSGGLGSCLYDAEGITARRRTIIEKGVLKEFYIDNYYARKLGVDPTGGSTTNVLFETGDKNLEQLIKAMKRGILVTGFIGGNSNSTTGDFSYGTMGAYIEDGAIIKPVHEMNISGNLIDLWQHLVEMGNDAWPYTTWRRPSMYFAGVQFSGA